MKTVHRTQNASYPSPKLTMRGFDFGRNVVRAPSVLFLVRFLFQSRVLERVHPIKGFTVLQCRAVVLEPADNVGASQAGLGLQLAVLLRGWPLSPTEHLTAQIIIKYIKSVIFKKSAHFTLTTHNCFVYGLILYMDGDRVKSAMNPWNI